jgi:integrase
MDWVRILAYVTGTVDDAGIGPCCCWRCRPACARWKLVGLRCQDIVLGPAAYVQCQGKGRKLRSTPLRKDTMAVLRTWLAERKGNPSDPAFPTIAGTPLSHDGLQYLLNKHLSVACRRCPSPANKRVTPAGNRLESTVRYLGVEVDDALEIAEKIDV